MTNKIYADGKGPTYTYTPDGKLATRTWVRGIVTTYTYDNAGNLTRTEYDDNGVTPTVTLAYNRTGRQTEAHDAAGVTTFIYDAYGANTNETVIGVAGTNIIDRYYDTFGRNAGYALNGIRQTTLGYDPVTGRLATMNVPDTIEGNIHSTPTPSTYTLFQWSYHRGGDLKSSLTYPNGLTAIWTYDANNQLLQVRNATPTNIISQYDYTYDAAGRRTACTQKGDAFAQVDTINYTYNIRSELTNALAIADANYNYAYNNDDIGNRNWSVERCTNTTYEANELNQYTAINIDSTVPPSETFTPLFDDDGNQTLVKTATGIWQVIHRKTIDCSNPTRIIIYEGEDAGDPLLSTEKALGIQLMDESFYDGY